MQRKPNIATVAEHAGVAVSTVSRYLNDRYVSQKARVEIARVIERLGYTRSSTARNLSLGRHGCIGVVVDSSQDPWFTRLLGGIETELSKRDSSLMLASTELTGTYDPAIVFEWIRERRVDGLIIAKSQRRDRPLIRRAVDAQIPAVLVAPDEAFHGVQLVRCDNRGAGVVVANYLAQLGHTRIGFAGGPRHSIDSKHRLQGLRKGLQKHRISLDPKCIFSCGSYEAAAGDAFAREFFELTLDLTAIVFANDALASGFMRVAHQQKIRIPEDLSIVGFDGLPEDDLLWPALTSVAQPMLEMGSAACRRLFEAIDSPGRVQTIEFPMSLTARESTAAPRGRVWPVASSAS